MADTHGSPRGLAYRTTENLLRRMLWRGRCSSQRWRGTRRVERRLGGQGKWHQSLSGYSDEVAAGHRNNGRAGLCEILVEAIWGEVLHYALPYGAVRMTAVIRTGETLASPHDPSGALGVREFACRPAHFMRAPAFQVRPENRALIPHDTARVKEAIARLPGMLPMPEKLSQTEITKLKPLRRLKIGLEEMVRRFGEQMASAKAKRLSHGTLTTSNVSLDGRWNDLNSVSALPGYGFRPTLTPFWNEQSSLLGTIDLLCFYINKYFPAASGEKPESMPSKEWLTEAYDRYYTDALHRRFVSLCGYPQIVEDKVWATQDGQLAIRQLADTLITLARSGHSPRRPYGEVMHADSAGGDYDLMKILKEMVDCRPGNDSEALLEPLIGDEALRKSFSRQYRVVEKIMLKEAKRQGVAVQCFARLVAINCSKATRQIPSLYRHDLHETCMRFEFHADLCEARRQADVEIQSMIDQARTLYQEPRNFKTLLWCADTATIEYDARTDLLIVDVADKKVNLSRTSAASPVQPDAETKHLLQSMQSYWGERYKEMLQ